MGQELKSLISYDAARVALEVAKSIDEVVQIQNKAEALRVHRTQHLSINRIWFNQPDLEMRLSNESFRQAWGPLLEKRPQDNLFSGMNTT